MVVRVWRAEEPVLSGIREKRGIVDVSLITKPADPKDKGMLLIVIVAAPAVAVWSPMMTLLLSRLNKVGLLSVVVVVMMGWLPPAVGLAAE